MPSSGGYVMDRRTALPIIVAAAALAVGSAGTAVAGHAAFSDASGTHEAGIHWLAETGVTAGCGGGRFCTEDAVKRGQMATFMHRLSGTAGVAPVVNADKVDGLDADQLRGQQGPAGPAGAPGATGSNGISAAYTAQGAPSAPGASGVAKLVLPAGSAYVVNAKGNAVGPGGGAVTDLTCDLGGSNGGGAFSMDQGESQTSPDRRISLALQGTVPDAATATTVTLTCREFSGGFVLGLKITAVAVDVLDDQSPSE